MIYGIGLGVGHVSSFSHTAIAGFSVTVITKLWVLATECRNTNVLRAGEVGGQGVQSCHKPREGVGWPGRRGACKRQARATKKSSELIVGTIAAFVTQCNWYPFLVNPQAAAASGRGLPLWAARSPGGPAASPVRWEPGK